MTRRGLFQHGARSECWFCQWQGRSHQIFSQNIYTLCKYFGKRTTSHAVLANLPCIMLPSVHRAVHLHDVRGH